MTEAAEGNRGRVPIADPPHVLSPHEYEVFEGASGMVCTAMVQDIRGDGDSCGLSASHPIHIRKR